MVNDNAIIRSLSVAEYFTNKTKGGGAEDPLAAAFPSFAVMPPVAASASARPGTISLPGAIILSKVPPDTFANPALILALSKGITNAVVKSLSSSKPSNVSVTIHSFVDVASGKPFYTYSTTPARRLSGAAGGGSQGVQVNFFTLLPVEAYAALGANITKLFDSPSSDFLKALVKELVLAAGPTTDLARRLANAVVSAAVFPTTPAPSTTSALNVGAIVGGVLGGLAAIGLIVGAVLICNKNKGPKVLPA